jgi:hypothetical protein
MTSPEIDWSAAVDASMSPNSYLRFFASRRGIPVVLGLEALGFLLVAMLIGMNEYLDLPHRIFGAPATVPRFSEIVVEGGLILILGVAITSASWVALRRLAYLESLLTLCGCCQKVSINGRWITFEAFVAQQDAMQTSHGLCPACFEREMLAE